MCSCLCRFLANMCIFLRFCMESTTPKHGPPGAQVCQGGGLTLDRLARGALARGKSPGMLVMLALY